jgi:microcin C transport system substrate-binding protein
MVVGRGEGRRNRRGAAVTARHPCRRTVLRAGAGLSLALAGLAAPRSAARADTGRRHGLSVFGDLAYGPDFGSFGWVDPAAPKGGRLVFSVPNWVLNQDTQTFDTLNSFVLKGSAPPRMEICYDTLMTRALDEPDAVYGLLAESVEVSADGNTFLFHLRPGARFSDGTPVTAEDVAFSYNLLKEKGHPTLSEGLRELANAEAIDATMVELSFTGRQSRSAPIEATSYPVLPAGYLRERDFEAATLEPIPGSGPYRVGAFEPGRFIEYDRVADWWAADLPVNVGRWHFDRIRIEFYRERSVEFEAFKKGEIRYREEFSSKSWATEYDIPAVRDGRIVRTEIPSEKRPSMQGWFLNLRRNKFADVRTREALGLLFDFEWTNRNLFYGLYERRASFFGTSDYAASGAPSPEELALLEPFRADLPEVVFGPAVMPPVSDGSGRDRALFRRAADLLAEAGWTRDGTGLRNAAGEPLRIEFMIDTSVFERILAPYTQNLRTVGIDASIRLVDPAQAQLRRSTFDYDVISAAFSMSPTPVESLDAFFHSRLADVDGSYNLSGVKHPAIDALVDTGGKAGSRAELVTVCRALDRVLRALHVWVPNWNATVHRVAYWDEFGRPAAKPDYGFPVESTWWIDPARAG